MKIGLRASPHIESLVESIKRHGDVVTSYYDGGCDFWLCWGWPSARDIAQANEHATPRIICIDCHPFALRAGDESGSRIFQLGSWGALAKYPDWAARIELPHERGKTGGPILVLGQVYTAEQARHGLVDVWHTGGYDDWVKTELLRLNRKFRKHPRIWAVENDGQRQPSLEEDLAGCSRAVSWNSTAAIHAKMLGYHAVAVEPHGWAHMSMSHLAGLVMTKADIASGDAWAKYRDWLRQ